MIVDNVKFLIFAAAVAYDAGRDQLPLFAAQKNSAGHAHDGMGVKVPSLTASKTAGDKGPVLLQDSVLLEHIAQFDRERTPERVAHAKGHGAHGVFQVENDITHLSKACLFKPGSKTPIFVRFSSVLGERGSADTLHDAHGFAIKFYTECGNWDLVGNNLELFMIRDPILFPSLIRSRKRNPQTGLRDMTSYWDFTSLRPETTFHTLQLNSYLGFPNSSRHMDGAGVHTFKLVSANRTTVYCKFHYLTEQGVGHTTVEEARELTKTPDYFQQDLYNAIARGEYPSWKFMIQVMTFEEARKVSFDPLDPTKIWPRDEFPLQPVGRFVLNRNPTNFFQETESVAFNPGTYIPGIEASRDRLLHGRIFSYPDSQRHRLGANFRHLPINRPLNFNAVNSYRYDGPCNVASSYTGPNYYPNSFGGAGIEEVIGPEDDHDYKANEIIRNDLGNEDNFSQAAKWFQSRSAEEKNFIASTISKGMAGIPRKVAERTIANFHKVDPRLSSAIMSGGSWVG